MSTGSQKPGAGAQGLAQARQKSKNEKDAGPARNSDGFGGADAQVGAVSAAFLGVLPALLRAEIMPDLQADAASGVPVEEDATRASRADGGEGFAGAAKEAQSLDDAPFAGAPRPETVGSAGSEPLLLAPFLVSSGAPSKARTGAAGEISAKSVIDAPSFDTKAASGAAAFSTSTQGQPRENSTPALDDHTAPDDTGSTRGHNQQGEPSEKTFVIKDGFGDKTVVGAEVVSDVDVIDLSSLSMPVTVSYTGDDAGTITNGVNTITFAEVERLVFSDDADVVTTSGTTAGIDVAAGAGDDVLMGTNLGTGHDRLDSGHEDDAISGEAGNDLIQGGAGGDMLHGGDSRDRLLAGDDVDLLIGGGNNNSLDGGAGDDTFRGDSDNNTLSGGDGNDRTEAGVHADTISGGTGADTVGFGSDFGNSDVTGGEGGVDTDVIDLSGVSGPVTITYTANEAGTITDGADNSAFSEVEQVLLSDAADVVNAGDAATGVNIAAVDGEDTVFGSDGDDILQGGRSGDTITGGTGDDVIDGGDSDDTAQYSGDLADFAITYDNATDRFTITDQTQGAGLGSDTVTGVETFVFDDGTLTAAELQTEAGRQANIAPTDIVMRGGTIQETVADGGTIEAAFDPSVKIVGNEIRVRAAREIDLEADTSFDLTVRTYDQYGEIYDKVLTNNVIDFGGSQTAGNGGETVTGTSEEDVVTGGLCNVVLEGGEGADCLEGGAGNDTLSGGAGGDTLRGGDWPLTDGYGNDQITSGAGDDVIDGGDGDDLLMGGSGQDTRMGGYGNDVLEGVIDDDLLEGGDGNDAFFVVAMQGKDTVEGGAGPARTDTLQRDRMGSGVSNVSDAAVDGVGWTIVLDGGHSIRSLSSGALELSCGASGVVTFDDGGTVTFADLERVTW